MSEAGRGVTRTSVSLRLLLWPTTRKEKKENETDQKKFLFFLGVRQQIGVTVTSGGAVLARCAVEPPLAAGCSACVASCDELALCVVGLPRGPKEELCEFL